MASARKTRPTMERVAVTLAPEDVARLDRLASAVDGNRSLALRLLLREAEEAMRKRGFRGRRSAARNLAA